MKQTGKAFSFRFQEANALRSARRLGEAEAAFRRLTKLRPRDPGVLAGLGQTLLAWAGWRRRLNG